MLDLEPIKARLAAATPWPWTWTHPDSDGGLVSETERDGETSDYDGRWVEYPAVVMLHGCESDGDDALIANAPADLATLVAEVERLRDEANRKGDGLAADLATCVRLRDQALAEVERLREGLEAIVGEPWLMGGQDACTIACATLYPATPPPALLVTPSRAKEGDQ